MVSSCCFTQISLWQYVQPVTQTVPSSLPVGGMGGFGSMGGDYKPAHPSERGTLPRCRNLHVSGYGMQTTKEELSQLFAPYCNLIDVIMKAARPCMFSLWFHRIISLRHPTFGLLKIAHKERWYAQ